MGEQLPNRRHELSRTGRLQQSGEWFYFTAGSAFLQQQPSAIVNEQPLLYAAAADFALEQQRRLRTAKVQRTAAADSTFTKLQCLPAAAVLHTAFAILFRTKPQLFGALSLLFGSIALLLGAEPELLRPKPQLQWRWRWWRQLSWWRRRGQQLSWWWRRQFVFPRSSLSFDFYERPVPHHLEWAFFIAL